MADGNAGEDGAREDTCREGTKDEDQYMQFGVSEGGLDANLARQPGGGKAQCERCRYGRSFGVIVNEFPAGRAFYLQGHSLFQTAILERCRVGFKVRFQQ
jgi:hypothetical protein